MKTASFFTYHGAGRISISRSPPRGTPAGYRVFKPLAPGPWFNSVDRNTYESLYAEQLALLDPQVTWDTLHALAGDHEPVLLCYEQPPFTESNHCHRRLVSAWIEQHLGHRVSEIGHE